MRCPTDRQRDEKQNKHTLEPGQTHSPRANEHEVAPTRGKSMPSNRVPTVRRSVSRLGAEGDAITIPPEEGPKDYKRWEDGCVVETRVGIDGLSSRVVHTSI